MDDARLLRLEMMHKQLENLVQKVELLLRGQETVTIKEEEEVRKLNKQLDSSIHCLSTEISEYIDKSTNVLVEKVKSSTELQLKAVEWKAELETLIETDMTSQTNPVTQSTKLPKLTLPHFKGEILRWNEFWDRFEGDIHKKNLPEADKLSYLLGCLEGEALETIEGLSTTHANYPIAVETLKSRYGNHEILIDAHYKSLHNSPQAKYSAVDCRATLNSVERHLRVLQSLGEKIEGNHFRTIITSKFPEQVIYELNLITKGKDIKTIREGLNKIITAMEVSKGDLSVPSTSQADITTGALQVYTETRPQLKRSGQLRRKPIKNTNDKFQGKAQKRKQSRGTQGTEQKKVKMGCVFCQGDHYNSNCPVFKTVEERKAKLKQKCYQCFKEGHRVEGCQFKKPCYYCKGDHNQALCFKKQSMDTFITKTSSDTTSNLNNNQSFLQTATVIVRQQNSNRTRRCRLVLDSGSARSYISTRLAKELNLLTVKQDLLMIYVFGSEKPTETISPSAEIEIETKRGVIKTIHVNIVPHIKERIPVSNLDEFSVDIVADDCSVGEKIDLLIGSDYYFSFIKNKSIKVQDNVFLIDTEFGWMLTGKILKQNKEDILTIITYCQCQEPESAYYTVPDLPLRETDLNFLWALESIGITDSPKVTREEEAVKHFNETVRYESQRYMVKWPWITYPPELPTNYGLAYGRLSSLVKRLDQETIKEYDSILQEQLAADVIEIIEPQPIKNCQNTPPIHYLPHHIIKQEGKRGRIVYDASAKLKDNKSLNECMYRGPSLLEDLTALLLKFRINHIGITADVEKAFLQVGLQNEDRDVTRFLWIRDLSKGVTEDNLLHLRFCRVPFGIISSPFLLTATIRHHLSRRDENLMKEIADRCYVDNLVTGADSISNARDLINRTREIFNELSMNIREWTSNNKKLMKTIPNQYRGKDTKQTKVLGLMWQLESDTLKLKLNDNLLNKENICKNNNKRGVLRTLASLYDPCGFAAPLILPAKLLLQELWRRKLKWDVPLPEDLEEQWNNAVNALQTAKEIEIPRFVGSTAVEETECELHCFTDASKNSFAAVTFLRIKNKNEKNYKTVFIMAKSRVTPITYKEDLKIPKLELLGYVIGKRLLNYVKDTLGILIKRQYLWTDSGIVLYWMKSEKLLPPFVSRRISEIKQSKDIEYRYVNTANNPADLATRPELWESKKELWFNGPQFLLQEENKWPVLPECNETTLNMAPEGLDLNPDNDDSDMQEIEQRDNLGVNYMEMNEEVTEKEINETENIKENNIEDHRLIELKKIQKLYFSDVIIGKETHLTRNLGIFKDVDGLLRCRGRFMNTVCSYDNKHPILIPKDCEFTDKLVQETHEKNHHVGASHTLSIIRQKYWIPHGKAKVQRILKKCSQCVKHGGGPYRLPPTPALPTERANYSAPFTYTGLDYFGPVFVQNNGKTEKRWVCLYTCLAVRAIHMEVVNDLTAEECLLALRRFVSARGLPELIVSDNALQFKLSAEVLSSTYSMENKIRWKFIPQLSPWHGGFYERLVGLVKNCLKRTLGKQLLTDTQHYTVIKEVEAVTNTRPLTSVGSEIEYVLRPVDFLTFGKCITIMPSTDRPEPGGTVTKQNLIESWKKGQVILEEFKRMFIGQYLYSLRERYQNSHKQPRIQSTREPSVGDIVQIKGVRKNRENWRVGKILSLIPGADGECRVAKVVSENKEFIRSVGHLYPLEVEEDTPSIPESGSQDVLESSSLERGEMTSGEILPSDLSTPIKESLNQVEIIDSQAVNTRTSTTDVPQEMEMGNDDEEIIEGEICTDRSRRGAALRAREKIAQWTRQLVALL